MNDKIFRICQVEGAQILEMINCAAISERFFNHSRAWLIQRLNNNTINGKPVSFTPEELFKLRASLRVLSSEIIRFANNIPHSALITSIKTKNKDRKLTLKALHKILENQQRQGDAGEDFVLEFEKERLSSHPQLEKVKRISIIDVSAGFDIISFDSEDSTKLDRFIEVKTFVGKPHFHWSINEIDVAKLQGNRYFLYLVDYQKIDTPEYRPMIIQNPIEFYSENNNWLSKAESFLIEYKGDYN